MSATTAVNAGTMSMGTVTSGSSFSHETSPAAFANLHVGDQLLAVNDIACDELDKEGFVTALAKIRPLVLSFKSCKGDPRRRMVKRGRWGFRVS